MLFARNSQGGADTKLPQRRPLRHLAADRPIEQVVRRRTLLRGRERVAMAMEIPRDDKGRIDPNGLPTVIRDELGSQVERDYPGATDAEKWRLLQAATLIYWHELSRPEGS